MPKSEKEIRSKLKKVNKELAVFRIRKEKYNMTSEDWENHDIAIGWRDALYFVLGDE